jgi:FkbM family methyltransferase
MNKAEDFFDKAVRYVGQKTSEKFVINIGAMDGILYDEMSAYTSLFGFKGLYVEPIPYLFEKLKSNFPTPGNLFENSAISDYNGQIRMLMIDEDAIKSGKVNQCFYGMSAVTPPKNGLGSDGDRETVQKYGKEITVPCLTFDALIEKYKIKNFDVLKIDAEGHDWTIFKTIDLDKYHPSVIRLEWLNLPDQERVELTEKLIKYNYLYEVKYGDITAITNELYNKVFENSEEAKTSPVKHEIPSPTENIMFTSVATTNHHKTKYKVDFEVYTEKDVYVILNQIFPGEISELNLQPVFAPVPIKFDRDICIVNDFVIEVSTSGIKLSFDDTPTNREKNVSYKNNKLLSSLEIPKVIAWLETMDSEQVYRMVKLSFAKV